MSARASQRDDVACRSRRHRSILAPPLAVWPAVRPAAADRLDRRRVVERRQVARIEAEPGRPDDASHDLARSGLRQRGHHDDRLRAGASCRDPRRPAGRSRRGAPRRRSRRGGASQTTTIASPLTAWGTPIAAASTTDRVGGRRGLDLRRPDALARDLERVVRAAPDVPVAVGVDRSPSRRGPRSRAAGSSTSRGSDPGRSRSRASCPAAAPGSRARRPRRGADPPSGSTTSAAVPRHGPLNDAGLIGAEQVAADDPAADLRPARVVDDRQPAAADLAEVPPPALGIPRLAGRAEDAQPT